MPDIICNSSRKCHATARKRNLTMNEVVASNWNDNDLLLMALFSAVTTAMLIWLLSPVARYFQLVDKPDSRKQHTGVVPLVGGLAITLSAVVTILVTGGLSNPSTITLLSVGTILCLLGMLDDYSEISPRYRLIVQIAVGLALCFVADLKIVSVGDLNGNGLVAFGAITSVVFTIMCSVGVFNSINMIDGIDGLAGVIVGLSAAALASIAFHAGDNYSSSVLIVVLASLAGFLAFNLGVFGRARKVFMGDAGSLFLGFILLWFFIHLSQSDNAPMSPVVAGWIFGLPLADTISVIVGRICRGQHPLSAGRDHIHHRLLNHGLSSRDTLFILGSYHAVLVVIGVLCNGSSSLDVVLFWGFIVLTITHFFVLKVFLPHKPLASDGVLPRPSARI